MKLYDNNKVYGNINNNAPGRNSPVKQILK